MSIQLSELSSLQSRRPRLDRGARILMIDQGSDIGVGLLLMFRIWGHAVSVARTWRHGLMQTHDLEPHVVVVNLDLLLPGTLASASRALSAADARSLCLVVLKGGMPYFVEEDAAGSPHLKLATTPALKTRIGSLVEPDPLAPPIPALRPAAAV